MSKEAFIRRGMAMYPIGEEAEELVRSIKEGAECMGEFKPARRPKQHRTFFALLKLLVDNCEAFDSIQGALTAIKIALGEVDPIIDAKTGKTFWTVRSISYESMDQARFSRLFDRALFVITERWLIGTDMEDLRQAVFDIVDDPRVASLGRRVA